MKERLGVCMVFRCPIAIENVQLLFQSVWDFTRFQVVRYDPELSGIVSNERKASHWYKFCKHLLRFI